VSKRQKIKLNDTYSVSKDEHCWHLNKTVPCLTKEGGESTKEITTYHPSLNKICREMLDSSAGDRESVKDILAMLESASNGLLDAVQSKVMEDSL